LSWLVQGQGIHTRFQSGSYVWKWNTTKPASAFCDGMQTCSSFGGTFQLVVC
jgi:hypothetical protein